MKKSWVVCLAIFSTLVTSGVGATLINNHDGTITQIRQNGSKLMWLADAKYAMISGYDADGVMGWSSATDWAGTLVFAGHDDWRLPSSLNTDGSEPCDGWSCTNSELGYLYYTELEDTEQMGYNTGNVNIGDFIDLPVSHIWTSTADPSDHNSILVFDFYGGQQTWHTNPDAGHWAMAVRDVHEVTPVPEPSTVLLLAGGLVGLAAGKARARPPQAQKE